MKERKTMKKVVKSKDCLPNGEKIVKFKEFGGKIK